MLLLVTQAAHRMCVCVWVGGMFTQMGKDRFLFFSSLSLSLSSSFVYTSPNNGEKKRKKVVASMTSDSSQVSRSSIYKSGFEE